MLRPIVIGTVLCFSGVAVSPAQEPWTARTWGDPDGFTGRDCETTMMLLDFVAIADRAGAKDQSIIIVARRGRGETSRTLVARRLKQVSDYMTRRVSRDKIVATEGGPLNGLAQLEFYVAGRLHTVIKIKRNRDIVAGCGSGWLINWGAIQQIVGRERR